MSKTPPKHKGDPETTGHQWDGIEEFNNPLPRWWLWTFYVTIIWAVAYTIAYPAWPMVTRATGGVLGWSSRGELANEIAAVDEANAAINAKLASADLAAVTDDPELYSYAVSAGAAVYLTWCAQCHGAGAAGVAAAGYPNLLDDDWLWGGDVDAIYLTIKHGIRNEEDDDARYSEMPAFGEILEPEDLSAVVNYVMTLSGAEPRDPSQLELGAQVYADNCAACHGEDGTGDRNQGAPNLTDAIWLYGGDYDTVAETVIYSRRGVMPAWAGRLTEAEIRAAAIYVHQLGGGE